MRKSPSAEFRRAFPGCPVEEVQEPEHFMRSVFGWLDVAEFDEWLSAQHGYDPQKESTLQFIGRVFGEEARRVFLAEVE